MENKDVLELKPSLFNLLMPHFLRHLFWNSLFFAFIYCIYYLVKLSSKINYDLEIIFLLVCFTLIFSFIKILSGIIINVCTTYKFYAHYVEYEFKFFKEKIHSVNYSQITDIQVKRTLWDRICGVGDLEIHTVLTNLVKKNIQ